MAFDLAAATGIPRIPACRRRRRIRNQTTSAIKTMIPTTPPTAGPTWRREPSWVCSSSKSVDQASVASTVPDVAGFGELCAAAAWLAASAKYITANVDARTRYAQGSGTCASFRLNSPPKTISEYGVRFHAKVKRSALFNIEIVLRSPLPRDPADY